MFVSDTVIDLTTSPSKDGKTLYYNAVTVDPKPGCRLSFQPEIGRVYTPGKYLVKKGFVSPSPFPDRPLNLTGELIAVTGGWTAVK